MGDDAEHYSPFEGPEKLLEVWFAPAPAHVPGADSAKDGKFGLRAVERAVWEDMLAIVRCKVLSVVEGDEMDAYLLSESSLFVSPHRLILKTCGTTLNLLGLPRILDIAAGAGLPAVHRLFYSRKSFMFPERQAGPHREWASEVAFLDGIFPNGSAYTVGRVNGDHWLLYMTSPVDAAGNPLASPALSARSLTAPESEPAPEPATAPDAPLAPGLDYTIEILMTKLGAGARAAFHTPAHVAEAGDAGAAAYGQELSAALGIADLFPRAHTTLDAYAFSPCGYSANALLSPGAAAGDVGAAAAAGPGAPRGEGYYTIHVTPEAGWSYASFECNVPLAATGVPAFGGDADALLPGPPDLRALVRRVAGIFAPGALTLTLFVSRTDADGREGAGQADAAGGAVEAAQRAFRAALAAPIPTADAGAPALAYRRTDKINYEFGDYDLAFASFELKP